MKLLLNSDLSEHQLVPKEYNLDIGTTAVNNTFVFTEEDLPGFKAKSKARTDAANMGFPASILRPKAERVEKPTYDRKRFQQPYYRKAIPSKHPPDTFSCFPTLHCLLRGWNKARLSAAGPCPI